MKITLHQAIGDMTNEQKAQYTKAQMDVHKAKGAHVYVYDTDGKTDQELEAMELLDMVKQERARKYERKDTLEKLKAKADGEGKSDIATTIQKEIDAL